MDTFFKVLEEYQSTLFTIEDDLCAALDAVPDENDLFTFTNANIADGCPLDKGSIIVEDLALNVSSIEKHIYVGSWRQNFEFQMKLKNKIEEMFKAELYAEVINE